MPLQSKLFPCGAALSVFHECGRWALIGGLLEEEMGTRSKDKSLNKVQVINLPEDPGSSHGNAETISDLSLQKIGRAIHITGEAARQILRAVHQCRFVGSPSSPLGQWKAMVDEAIRLSMRRLPSVLRNLSDSCFLLVDSGDVETTETPSAGSPLSLEDIVESLVAFSVSLPATRRLPGTWVVDGHSQAGELLLLDDDGVEAKVLASSVPHAFTTERKAPSESKGFAFNPSLAYSEEAEKPSPMSQPENASSAIALEVAALLAEGGGAALSSHAAPGAPSEMSLDLPQATPPLLRGDSTGRSQTAYESHSPSQTAATKDTESLAQLMQAPLCNGSVPLLPAFWTQAESSSELTWKGVYSIDLSVLRTQMDVAEVAQRHAWLLPGDDEWRKDFLVTVLHCLPQVLESHISVLSDMAEAINEESKGDNGEEPRSATHSRADLALLRRSWALSVLGTCVRVIPELLKDNAALLGKELLPGLQGLLSIAATPLSGQHRTLTEWQAVLQGVLFNSYPLALSLDAVAFPLGKSSM